MDTAVLGIHHITAIAGDAQRNVDFYTGVLGLRFIKKTVNFDDPFTYHTYFGNDEGSPGTALTFFPWGTNAAVGRRGSGQVTAIGFSAPANSKDYWMERLNKLNILFTGPFNRFDESYLVLEDYDSIELELIFNDNDARPGLTYTEVPKEFSIRGFYNASFLELDINDTEPLLNVIGFTRSGHEGNRVRYSAGDKNPGTFVDIIEVPESVRGRMGTGAVHHIAFRAKDDTAQLILREELLKTKLDVTPVINRSYFKSIYFREPGNILFEIATDGPGFLIDEDLKHLGESLKLPPWYEKIRQDIESTLPELKVVKYVGD